MSGVFSSGKQPAALAGAAVHGSLCTVLAAWQGRWLHRTDRALARSEPL